jgi:polysaccharide export outer membrane protein
MKLKNPVICIAVFSFLWMAVAPGAAQSSRLKPETPATTEGNASSSAGAARPETAEAVKPDIAPDYIIGPDDVLVVNVWKEPDLSRSVLVRPDGKITLPLLKDIDASGNTPDQLQARIEHALADFISKPAVTVIVQEAKSHKFNILGSVQKPGSYVIARPMTVLDAIALAGGLREWAKTSGIYVLRETGPGNRERIPFNYKKVVKGQSPDIPLRIKDTIVVP